ncbi:organic cation/carnitine transporter 2-like [Phalaenopsis equestris]|uniref:organic cation/carnitine transporter 2-like n=1 Tax=Phalaenopsis equestris TaxID=78828 RepID=UPI0009E2C07A|nr:organic cation/carnitine transporter 2-like [Phalaenopsis equestris]
MADDAAAPLLPSSGELITTSAARKDPSFNRKNTPTTSINDAIEPYMDSAAGARHLLLPALAAFAWFFDAQQVFISIFSDASPPWHCTTSPCTPSPTPCTFPPASWSYSFPNHISTISDFSLYCSSPVLLGLPTSSFYAGCFFGGLLLATIADSQLGRKNTLVLTTLLMSITSALTAMSPNIAVYAALRFASGLTRANIGTSAFVLSSELISLRHRDVISILNFFFYTTGFLSLPAIAFLNRASSWRSLYLYTSIPCFFYSIILHFSMKESPRWLLVKGRTEEAIQTLKNLTFIEKQSFSDLTEIEITSTENDIFSAARILWERPWALRRLAVITVVSFGIGTVYYGMPLNLGNLSANLYLSTALNAVAELPSSLASFFLIRWMERRKSIITFTAMSGICSFVCTVMTDGGWVEMTAELGSFFAACTACSVMIIYGAELFPTCVRNSAIAVVRQVVVLGGAGAPVMVVAGRRYKFLSFGVFGAVIVFTGLFAGLLPETKGCGISDTIEEEEEKVAAGRNAGRRLC